MRAAVITVSDSRAAGEEEGDESGDLLAAFAESLGLEVFAREVVADEQREIEERLRHWADEGGCELILTTGGTGVSPRDFTPEATESVLDRLVPGISEALRADATAAAIGA